jgi:mono/diheme cytochrome c family protein
MKKVLLLTALAWVGIAALGGWAPDRLVSVAMPELQPLRAQAELTGEVAEHRAWLNQYCVGCHNSRIAQPSAEPVDLETASLTDLAAHAETWERVVRKLGVRAMPPEGMPRPEEAEFEAFTTWLTSSLDRAAAEENNPGRYVVHRLNRVEYANAIRDLLALDIDVSDLLPSDGGDFGFDNIATALPTTPLLLERYLTAAMRISALAVGDAERLPGATLYTISLEVTQDDYVQGLPLGTRGGTVVRHIFPADAEYELSAQLNRTILNGYAGVEGHDEPWELIFTVDGEQVFSTTVGGPEDHELSSDDTIAMGLELDDRLRSRVYLTAGPHDVGFTWVDRPTVEAGVWQPALRDSQEVHLTADRPRLRRLSVEGPYNVTGISDTPSRDLLFVCRPAAAADEAACAEENLSNFARRAFRRPVTDEDVAAPLEFYNQTRADGGSFDDGIRLGVARVLASPSFIYRVETDPVDLQAGVPHAVTDLELASRLSFFLWSSIPDEELLNIAIAGRLRDPGVLAGQVQRMALDARSSAMVEDFTGQWLRLRNLEARVSPDILMFPDFDANIREAFRTETQMFFAEIMRENLSALELLDADFTFLNERLARHYGIEGIYGSRFRRVQIDDLNRRGLLGHGSILSQTSVATRTSPVLRGVFILQTFLNTPPPAPPANVPTLEESEGSAEAPRTVREQIETHRANPVCASCHRVIDPVGFALENFNALGQWRDTDLNGAPIDASGVLADGSEVSSPSELRESILSRPDAFAIVLTERLMTYALGRGLEPADMSVVRDIVRTAAQNDYRFMSIVSGIVESAPFQNRTKLEINTAETTIAQTDTRVN